jgi:uncharacterized protein
MILCGRLINGLVVILVALGVHANFAFAAFEVPPLTGPVVDQAKIIDSPTEAAITTALWALRDSGGSQINVLTVSSLEGLTIEQASIQVVDQWKLGGRNTDNGVLLMVAPNDRRIRIEVGQGLEGSLTDVDSKRIISESVAPLFRAGDYPSGILVGVYQITKKTDPQFDIAPYLEGRERSVSRSSRGDAPGRSVFMFIVLMMVLIFISRLRGPSYGGFHGPRRGYPGGWGGGGWGGGSGGGGWSGGGGGFSGGGASGDW